jgi:hypothetical protein
VVEDEEESDMAADQSRPEVFPELNVRVRDGEVRTMGVTWQRSRQLGPLAGAWAGVNEQKELRGATRLIARMLGATPRIGTIFVTFADGTRYETPLRLGGEDQSQALQADVESFNALAKSASDSEQA